MTAGGGAFYLLSVWRWGGSGCCLHGRLVEIFWYGTGDGHLSFIAALFTFTDLFFDYITQNSPLLRYLRLTVKSMKLGFCECQCEIMVMLVIPRFCTGFY